MNCANWEERIALYMGGDLAETEEVERHLRECHGCQVFASGMRESLTILREAHTGGVNQSAMAAVRARVLAELEMGRRPWWRRFWVYGLAASAALILALVWMAPRRNTEVAHVAKAEPPKVAEVTRAEAPEVVPAATIHRHRRLRAGARMRVGPPLVAMLPEKPLVVKLVTDDPNVVIYWITDTRGE